MIHSDDDLRITREQLGRLERALDALHRELRPQSQERYRLMAEPYVDHIQELRDQIDEYLGVKPLLRPGPADTTDGP